MSEKRTAEQAGLSEPSPAPASQPVVLQQHPLVIQHPALQQYPPAVSISLILLQPDSSFHYSFRDSLSHILIDVSKSTPLVENTVSHLNCNAACRSQELWQYPDS